MFTTLAIQSWTLYAVSISLIFSRLTFRRITLGSFKKLQADDWIMLCILLPYTASITFANQLRDTNSLTERKFRYVLEEMQIITIWLVKACLLVLYWRIFPVETSLRKRRALQAMSAFCCASFLIIQLSLVLWCQPTEGYWGMSIINSQCTSYYNHNALSLSFEVMNTTLIMLLAVPFIPTPRRTLLAVLLLLGTLVLTTGILSRTSILTHPTSATYLHWTTAEASLSIIFANLPFLTSLVVTTAPARIRQMSFSQWPRSRCQSWELDMAVAPQRSSPFGSMATTISEIRSFADMKREPESPHEACRSIRHSTARSHASSPALPTPPILWDTRGSRVWETRPRDSGASGRTISLGPHTAPIFWDNEASKVSASTTINRSASTHQSAAQSIHTPPTSLPHARNSRTSIASPRHSRASGEEATTSVRPGTRWSMVSRTRLSGGLAEMGDPTPLERTEGWPIYWE